MRKQYDLRTGPIRRKWWIFLLPLMAAFCIGFVWPFIQGIYLSFCTFTTTSNAKLNGIMTLAEGVETSNELRQLIDLGVDLIQGYYTGRPQAEPITALQEEIRREILAANPTFAQQSQLN